jgi:hypothetical protein
MVSNYATRPAIVTSACLFCRFYCEEALELTSFKLSPLQTYFIPEVGSLQSFRDYIITLPTADR